MTAESILLLSLEVVWYEVINIKELVPGWVGSFRRSNRVVLLLVWSMGL